MSLTNVIETMPLKKQKQNLTENIKSHPSGYSLVATDTNGCFVLLYQHGEILIYSCGYSKFVIKGWSSYLLGKRQTESQKPNLTKRKVTM